MLAGSGACAFGLAETREQMEALASRLLLPENYLRFASSFAQSPQWRGTCSTP
ncbi:MAG: hypothetical protein JO101_10515 [Candidatus Eremiobacteraeota bacterium]|nr:hypothetical protein [Candidatus Eremiobacteraeota bacterium]